MVRDVLRKSTRGRWRTWPSPLSGVALLAALSSTSPSSSNAADAGTAVAPEVDRTPDGGRLSPLTPSADEFSDAAVPPMGVDYDRLLTEIAALRARVSAVSDTLFRSRVALTVEVRGDHFRIATFSVSLDDGIVWTSPPGFHGDDAVTVYEHAAAPGRHTVGVDIERSDDQGSEFRSFDRSRFVVEIPNEGRLLVALQLTDDSNMGADFRADKKGQYDLRIVARGQAQTVPR